MAMSLKLLQDLQVCLAFQIVCYLTCTIPYPIMENTSFYTAICCFETKIHVLFSFSIAELNLKKDTTGDNLSHF